MGRAFLGWEVGVFLLRRDIAGGVVRVHGGDGEVVGEGHAASLGSDAGVVTG